MWAFGLTKQGIILRNPFFDMYLGGNRGQGLVE